MPLAWLTPDVSPDDNICVTVVMPNNQEFLRIIAGTLLSLLSPENYEQFDALTPEETAERMTVVYDSFAYGAYWECGMIGAVIAYLTPNVPSRCLPCDGGIYNRSDYPVLYGALVGTPHIFDADHFTTPDLSGMFLRGATPTSTQNNAGGSDANFIGLNHIPPHTHGYQGVLPNIDLELAGVPDVFGAGINPITVQTGSAGSGDAITIIPRYYSVKYAIIAK
jgi:hypothetical protein